MIDNRVFNEAMEASRAAAERGDWGTALDEAETAIAARPDDADARSELAVALYHNGQYARAIKVLEGLHAKFPDELVTLAYLARAYEGDNQHSNAAATLITLGEQATAQQLLNDALEAFEEAVRLAPDDERPRIHLAEVLVALGERIRAAEQCMHIAQHRHAEGDSAGAREALDEALSLDSGSHQARRLLAELNKAHAAPSDDGSRAPAVSDAARITQLATQAMAHQRAGEITEALQLYNAAIHAGAERPDVWYNSALLHAQQGEHDAASTLLQQALTSPEYEIKAATALGNAQRNTGDAVTAIDTYTIAIAKIDPNMISRADATDVIELYHAAADTYAEQNDFTRASALCETLATMLQQKRWGRDLADQQRALAKQFTQRLMTSRLQQFSPNQAAPTTAWSKLASLHMRHGTSAFGEAEEDPFATFQSFAANNEQLLAPVTPIDTAACSEPVARLVEASGRFIEQGLVWAAIDACHEVIRHDVAYLPIHLRLSEIYERQGRVEDALSKYRTLIDTYVARENIEDAIAVYERIFDLAPDNMDAREQVVALLRQVGRTDTAAVEAITVANTAFRLGQTSRALAEFEAIHTWAPPSTLLHVEHGRALLKLERWQEAAAQFEQATEREPEHVVALALRSLTLALMDAPDATLWDTFAALLALLNDDVVQHAAVQAEYRLALLLVDNAVLHLLLGLLQQAAQQDDLALLSFEQALNVLDTDDDTHGVSVLVHQAIVPSYGAHEQPDDALDHLYEVQRLLRDQPTLPSSPHAFARPLMPPEVERMITELKYPNGVPNSSDTEAAASALEEDEETAFGEEIEQAARAQEDTGFSPDQAAQSIVVATQPAPPVPQRAERNDALESIAALEKVARLRAEAGRIDEALAALNNAAMSAWMLGQATQAVRLIEQGVVWAPEHLRAWQQQVHVFLLVGDEERAVAAQRQVVQLAAEQQHPSLAGSLQQLLALDPNDPDAHMLFLHVYASAM